MKKYILMIMLGMAANVTAQQSNITGMHVLGQAVAAEYGKWSAAVVTGTLTAGSQTVIVDTSSYTVPAGMGIMPITTGIPILIVDGARTETVTLSSVSCASGSGICQFTATFSQIHPAAFRIGTGTCGLQEAIADTIQSPNGGTVVITSDWSCPTAILTITAVGSTNVVVRDMRKGDDIYTWNGSHYVITGGGGGGGGGVVASGRLTGRTAAVASVTTWTPSSDGSYEISANMLATNPTNFSFNVVVHYTDENNVVRAVTLSFLDNAASSIPFGSGVAPITTTLTSASGPWFTGLPLHIRVKANTAITVSTSGLSFTSVVYNVEAVIRLLM